jgi:chromosome segregation ATPase
VHIEMLTNTLQDFLVSKKFMIGEFVDKCIDRDFWEQFTFDSENTAFVKGTPAAKVKMTAEQLEIFVECFENKLLTSSAELTRLTFQMGGYDESAGYEESTDIPQSEQLEKFQEDVKNCASYNELVAIQATVNSTVASLRRQGLNCSEWQKLQTKIRNKLKKLPRAAAEYTEEQMQETEKKLADLRKQKRTAGQQRTRLAKKGEDTTKLDEKIAELSAEIALIQRSVSKAVVQDAAAEMDEEVKRHAAAIAKENKEHAQKMRKLTRDLVNRF